jgi:hypothetical protein
MGRWWPAVSFYLKKKKKKKTKQALLLVQIHLNFWERRIGLEIFFKVKIFRVGFKNI